MGKYACNGAFTWVLCVCKYINVRVCKHILWDYYVCEFVFMCEYGKVCRNVEYVCDNMSVFEYMCVRVCGSEYVCVCECVWECTGACKSVVGLFISYYVMCHVIMCECVCTHFAWEVSVSPVTSWLSPPRGGTLLKDTLACWGSSPPWSQWATEILAGSQGGHRTGLLSNSSMDDCKELWSRVRPSSFPFTHDCCFTFQQHSISLLGRLSRPL